MAQQIDDRDIGTFARWAFDFESRLPDPTSDGVLAAEFRTRVTGHLATMFPPVAPPFDIVAVAAGDVEVQTSLATLLSAVRFYLVTANPPFARLAAELVWGHMKTQEGTLRN